MIKSSKFLLLLVFTSLISFSSSAQMSQIKSTIDQIDAESHLRFLTADELRGADFIQNDLTRTSVGVQVEWQSPFGAINLIYGYALDDVIDDEKAPFEFSMGSKF